MRKLLILLLFWSGICLAQGTPGAIEYNFGDILSDKPVTHDFEFKEKIKSVVSLCECVKVSTLEENSKTPLYTVHVEFDPKDYSGDVQEKVIVEN
jgi:hypothetical protein